MLKGAKVTLRGELLAAGERLAERLYELFDRHFSICYEDNDFSVLLSHAELRFERRYAEFLRGHVFLPAKDWARVRAITLRALDAPICVICLAAGAELLAPFILRCHHVFCLPCVVRQCLDSAPDCCVCKKRICWREIKPLRVERFELAVDDARDFTLFRLHSASRERVDEERGVVVSGLGAIRRAEFEQLALGALAEIAGAAARDEIDALVARACESILLRLTAGFREEAADFEPRARRGAAKADAKAARYSYQLATRHNAFLHPIECVALRDESGPLPRVELRVVDLKRISQTQRARALYKEICHLPLGAEFIIVRTRLECRIAPAKLRALNAECEAFDRLAERQFERAPRRAPTRSPPPTEEIVLPRRPITAESFPQLELAGDVAAFGEAANEWNGEGEAQPKAAATPVADFPITRVKRRKKGR